MKHDEAVDLVTNAVSGYVQECISSPEFEDERKELDDACALLFDGDYLTVSELKIAAIRARIYLNKNHPALKAFGNLTTTSYDIMRIIDWVVDEETRASVQEALTDTE